MIKNANDNSKNEENIDNADRTGNNWRHEGKGLPFKGYIAHL
jgi:hypothetical protein